MIPQPVVTLPWWLAIPVWTLWITMMVMVGIVVAVVWLLVSLVKVCTPWGND